jgi:murein DD-endopeptidase MepM/ murein hydrolase activator NlpD
LQKPTDGAGRRTDNPRPARRVSLATRVNRRSVAAARVLQAWFRARPAASTGSIRSSLAAALRPFTTAERALPIAVAAIVAIASLLALLPNTTAGTTGATAGSGTAVRLAVNGGIRYLDATGDAAAIAAVDAAKATAAESFAPLTLPADIVSSPNAAPSAPGVVQADGTLITGYAPNTIVEDASALIQTYKVQSGDTLSGIASKFKISTMTLWWANSLKSKDALHVGQLLRIPPANGLVITVTATDTLDSLAAKYGIDGQAITDINQLTDPTLVLGQVLVIPGALGAPIPTPIPTPKPTPKPVARSTTQTRTTTSSSKVSSGIGGSYSGGRLAFPVVGGHHYISQYFHSGHIAIDIAADFGAPVVAAAAGKVVWAGWRNDGGGNEVWISHGGLYTRYCHMSAILVSAGQYVGRGQQVGRIGMTGWATGPHLHFEVWVGPIGAGYAVNPMGYF